MIGWLLLAVGVNWLAWPEWVDWWQRRRRS